MNSIKIQKIGITDLDTDAIVNAANEGLWAGVGVLCCLVYRNLEDRKDKRGEDGCRFRSYEMI